MAAEHTVAEIKKFFGTDEKPVDAREMMDFWNSLTDDEKAVYRKSDLD